MAFFGTLFGYLNFSLLIFLGLGPAARWCVVDTTESSHHLFPQELQHHPTPKTLILNICFSCKPQGFLGQFPGMRMHVECICHMFVCGPFSPVSGRRRQQPFILTFYFSLYRSISCRTRLQCRTRTTGSGAKSWLRGGRTTLTSWLACGGMTPHRQTMRRVARHRTAASRSGRSNQGEMKAVVSQLNSIDPEHLSIVILES
jgi:hypothetical protein